jgi:hypothetical protein
MEKKIQNILNLTIPENILVSSTITGTPYMFNNTYKLHYSLLAQNITIYLYPAQDVQ